MVEVRTQLRCWMLAGRVAALASPTIGKNGRGWSAALAPPATHAASGDAARLPRETRDHIVEACAHG